MFFHFSSPSASFSCLSDEFHHLVLSSPWALFQVSLCKWEPIQSKVNSTLKFWHSAFRRLKAKPFLKSWKKKGFKLKSHYQECFIFSCFVLLWAYNLLGPTFKEIEEIDRGSKNNLEFSIKKKTNSTFNTQEGKN